MVGLTGRYSNFVGVGQRKSGEYCIKIVESKQWAMRFVMIYKSFYLNMWISPEVFGAIVGGSFSIIASIISGGLTLAIFFAGIRHFNNQLVTQEIYRKRIKGIGEIHYWLSKLADRFHNLDLALQYDIKTFVDPMEVLEGIESTRAKFAEEVDRNKIFMASQTIKTLGELMTTTGRMSFIVKLRYPAGKKEKLFEELNPEYEKFKALAYELEEDFKQVLNNAQSSSIIK
jgi:hypothetical protein